MAEPFSTAAAGIALIANLKNLYDYLKEVKDGIDNIHEDIDALQKEIGTLKELCESVVDLLRDGQDKRSLLDAEQEKRWNGLSKPLQTMEVAIQEFDEKLRKVFGNNPKRRAYKESVKKWRRFKEVESALSTLRSTISNNREKIVVWMHSIGISKMCVFRTSWMVSTCVLT
jgi:chromosome segregation ATPase